MKRSQSLLFWVERSADSIGTDHSPEKNTREGVDRKKES
jgi:hypothetical protein